MHTSLIQAVQERIKEGREIPEVDALGFVVYLKAKAAPYHESTLSLRTIQKELGFGFARIKKLREVAVKNHFIRYRFKNRMPIYEILV